MWVLGIRVSPRECADRIHAKVEPKKHFTLLLNADDLKEVVQLLAQRQSTRLLHAPVPCPDKTILSIPNGLMGEFPSLANPRRKLLRVLMDSERRTRLSHFVIRAIGQRLIGLPLANSPALKQSNSIQNQWLGGLMLIFQWPTPPAS